MKFTEILEELKKGEKVTREEWEECKTECYKYIKLEHGGIIAYLKDDNGEDKVEERTKCMFELADFTAEDWKIYEEPTKNWKPKEGESYYYICSSGVISNDTFSEGWSQDKLRRDFCNAFKTEEESKKMIEKIKIINKLRELSNIDFNDDCKEEHYVISYNNESKKIVCDVYHLFVREIPFNIYFKTEEDCQKAIETIGEENLKKYYFDVED